MRQAFFKINKVFNGLLCFLLFMPSKTPFIVRIMNNPLISVIVPIYGIERYVGHCIESLMRQTYQNLEIILVDDGSPDRCPQICDLYASKDKRIKVIHKENGGIVTARKAGVKIAQGEYIGFVDGDDWVGEGYFQSMLNSIYNKSIEGKKVVITNADYDYVLMAGLDSSFKEMVIRTLADYGVAPDNVLPVEMNYEIRHEILMDYLKCEGKNA